MQQLPILKPDPTEYSNSVCKPFGVLVPGPAHHIIERIRTSDSVAPWLRFVVRVQARIPHLPLLLPLCIATMALNAAAMTRRKKLAHFWVSRVHFDPAACQRPLHSHHTEVAALLNHGAGEAFSEDFIDKGLIWILIDCQKVLLRQEPTALTLIIGLLLLRLILCHSLMVPVSIYDVIAQVRRSLPKFSNYVELRTVMNKMD